MAEEGSRKMEDQLRSLQQEREEREKELQGLKATLQTKEKKLSTNSDERLKASNSIN